MSRRRQPILWNRTTKRTLCPCQPSWHCSSQATPYVSNSSTLWSFSSPLNPFSRVKGPHISLPSNPLYVPLENVANGLHDFIWDRVLQFAIDVDPRPHTFPKDDVVFQGLNSSYEHISMVSKTFRVRYPVICLIYFFQWVDICFSGFPFLTSTVS